MAGNVERHLNTLAIRFRWFLSLSVVTLRAQNVRKQAVDGELEERSDPEPSDIMRNLPAMTVQWVHRSSALSKA